jgi:polyhydroxybutyrate depolymerase
MFAAKAVMLAFALFGAAAAAHAETMVIDGRERSFRVHQPQAVAKSGKLAPLVVVLHGGGSAGWQMRRWFRMDAVADREGFVVAYPDGIASGWNDGRTAAAARRHAGDPPDDVAFLTALVKALVARGVADPKRVFVTGASNGGMMSYRLACETKGVFAGYAATIANVPKELSESCRPEGPVPMLMMVGTVDGFVPFAGGAILGGKRGSVISAAETFAFWRVVNRCSGAGKASSLPDRDPTDGSHIELTRAEGCAAPTLLYTVVNGGHQTPSIARGWTPVMDKVLGRANRDLEAAEEIWRFFAAIP